MKFLEQQCKDYKYQAQHQAATAACLRMKLRRVAQDGGDENTNTSAEEQLYSLSAKIVRIQFDLKECKEKCNKWEKRYRATKSNPAAILKQYDNDDDCTTGWKQSAEPSERIISDRGDVSTHKDSNRAEFHGYSVIARQSRQDNSQPPAIPANLQPRPFDQEGGGEQAACPPQCEWAPSTRRSRTAYTHV